MPMTFHQIALEIFGKNISNNLPWQYLLDSLRVFLHCQISLDLSLVDAVDRYPGEEPSNEAAPECVTISEVCLEIEQFHPATFIVPLPDSGGSSNILVPLDDDGEEAAKHAAGLEDVRPDDSLDATNRGVEYTDGKYNKAGNVEVESCNLKIRTL